MQWGPVGGTDSVHRGTGLEQRARDHRVAPSGRPMQGSPVVKPGVYVRTFLDKVLNAQGITRCHGLTKQLLEAVN